MTIRSFMFLTLIVAKPCPSQTPQTRLWDAAISGDTSALAAALKDGAQIDALDVRTSRNGRRALNWAAINNRVDAIRFLLAHGAQIEATPLARARQEGHVEVAKLLEGAERGVRPQDR